MINISEKEKEQQCKTDEEEPLTEIEKKFFDKIFDDIWKEIAMSEEELKGVKEKNGHKRTNKYDKRRST